jgi:hypothetical protein
LNDDRRTPKIERSYGGLDASGIPDIIKEWILFKSFYLAGSTGSIGFFLRFQPETGNLKFPNNPVNPACPVKCEVYFSGV